MVRNTKGSPITANDAPTHTLSNARDHLIAMKNSEAWNGTALAVIESLLQPPYFEQVDIMLLTGTRDQVGRKRWDKLTRSITRSWARPFIRFIDGNIQNCNFLNLTYESPDDVLVKNWANPDWRVDWDMDLSDDEVQIVLNPEWRKGLRFRRPVDDSQTVTSS